MFSLTSSNGFSQLISEPTHFQTNSSSLLDFIFTNQPNLSVNSGVRSPLHQNCHHQIVYSTFNLDIYYGGGPYQRLVWDYEKADSATIRKFLDSVNWERLLDHKHFNIQVMTLIETILNVFRNYVPNKYITVDDKDPVWMNETIKSKIKTKNKLYKQDIENGRFESDFVFIETLKDLYYKNLAKRLNNPLLQGKTYWPILKPFYNDKKFLYFHLF